LRANGLGQRVSVRCTPDSRCSFQFVVNTAFLVDVLGARARSG
jgi:hypothetical protein